MIILRLSETRNTFFFLIERFDCESTKKKEKQIFFFLYLDEKSKMKLKNWSQTVNLISLIIILMISRVKNDPKLNRLSYNCKEEEQSKFENCQADAEYDWDIRDVDQDRENFVAQYGMF
ncbi:hypothetical protein SSS_04704 [Sarcoptes scabiei]|nr:hypothetical protein SSS_04704 [Sarcoptes scabiei]